MVHRCWEPDIEIVGASEGYLQQCSFSRLTHIVGKTSVQYPSRIRVDQHSKSSRYEVLIVCRSFANNSGNVR